MALLRITARELTRRPGRAVLTLLSVVIGVAAVTAVSLVTTTTRRAYTAMHQSVAGRAALEVVADGDGGFDQAVTAGLPDVPGVQAALPVVQRYTILYYRQQRFRLLALGVDAESAETARDYALAAGRFCKQGPEGLLAAPVARGLGLHLNDEVKILTRSGVKSLTVVGWLAPQGAALFRQGEVLVLPLRTAQRLLGTRGRIDTVQLVLQEGAVEAAVAAEVAGRLPPGLRVRPPAARMDLMRDTLAVTERGLHLAGALALLAAGFVILNTFLMNVTERRRDLAVLRALGATRRQVLWLLLREGLLLGATGTGLGLVAGGGGAYLLLRVMEQLFRVALPPAQLAAGPLAAACVLGLGVSLLATCIPAWKASHIPPLEGLREGVLQTQSGIPLWLTGVAVGVCLVAVGASLGSTAGWWSVEVLIPAQTVAAAACVFVLPLILERSSRGLLFLLRPVFRSTGRLAQRQLLRQRTRTTLTVGVVFVALTVGIGMGHSIMNAMQDVTHWFHRTVTHDFFLWTVLPDVATGQSAEMPTALEAEIRMLAGVAHVDTVRCVSGAAAGQPVLFIVRGFGTPGFLSLNLHKGDPEAVRQRLVQGEVAIGTALAQKIGRHPGQTLNLDTPQGPRAVRIAGTVNEYTVNGMTIHIAREPARRLLAVEGIDALAIACQPGFRDQVEAALRALSAQHGLLFQSLADLRDELDRMTAGFVASLWALLVLGFVVADLGLVNTLTMNMLEQTRELGLLRVVGMTRGQLRRLTFAQAVLMAGIGAVPGVLAGFGMAYLLHLSATPLSGHPSPFQLVPLWLIGWPTGALLVGLLAAWLPAERAARLPPTEALKYE